MSEPVKPMPATRRVVLVAVLVSPGSRTRSRPAVRLARPAAVTAEPVTVRSCPAVRVASPPTVSVVATFSTLDAEPAMRLDRQRSSPPPPNRPKPDEEVETVAECRSWPLSRARLPFALSGILKQLHSC